MNFHHLVVAVINIAIFTPAAQTQVVLPDWDTVEIKAHKVRANLYMLEGFGGNIGALIGNEGWHFNGRLDQGGTA